MAERQTLKCELKTHIPAMIGRAILGGLVFAVLGAAVIEAGMLISSTGAEATAGEIRPGK